MKACIYVDREDHKLVEQEEKNLFIKKVLNNIGIPDLEEYWPNLELSAEEKKELRKYLSKYDILILGQGGNSEIYVGDDLIAQWKRPSYKLKIDNKQINPAKRLFLEMTIECYSVFDEDNWDEENE